MVSKKSRKRMKEYVVERLEDSGIHVARDVSRDCLQLKTNGEKGAYVFLHTTPEGSEDFIHNKLHRLIYSGNFVSNIFYKDGENFFVLLDDNLKDSVADKSMKKYSYSELCKAVRLRDKEREVLRMQAPKRLVYYQPDNTAEGGRLREGLVSFTFKSMIADYSHKQIGDSAFDFIMADDGKVLKTRFISDKKNVLEGRLQLKFSKRSPHLPILGSSPTPVSFSPRAYDFSPTSSSDVSNESVRYFLDQTGTKLPDWGESVEDIENYLNPQ